MWPSPHVRASLGRLCFLANIDDRTGREILKQTFLTEEAKTPKRHAADCGFQGFHSLRSEVAMSIFSYRKHLRFLSQAQRRRWWDQKKRLTPRIVIGAAYVPPNVTREFAYIKVG
jgi:hypothetical protein